MNANRASEINLKEIVDISFVPIKLPDDKYLADITYLEKYGDYYFILDREVSPSITVIDESGQYVDQLRKFGYGPEEFIYLGNFNLNSKGELMIYDRERLRLIFYTFPDFTFIKSQQLEEY